MQLGFLGHNGFSVGDQGAPVLIDAILLSRYGEEYTSSPVEIYPPRDIALDRMPVPSAVVISHEHSDHYHLPSLDKIDRDVPIVVGPLMIDRAVKAVEALGFTVHRLGFGETRRYGSVLITLFPAGADTVLWESRVSQVYVRDAEDPEIGGIYLGIDALISDEFVAQVEEGSLPRPAAVAVSNNAQITPPGVFGSLDNLRSADMAEHHGRRAAFAGLEILQGIIAGTIEQTSVFRGSHFLICGGGFLKDYEQMGPFPFSEQKELADHASELSRWVDVCGPEPGDILEVGPEGISRTGLLTWLGTDRQRFAELRARRDAFLGSGEVIPLRRIIATQSAQEEDNALRDIEKELAYLARAILLSPLGQDLIEATRAADQDLRPLVLKLLRSHREDVSLAFDLGRGAFLPVEDLPLAETLEAYPYGIVVHASDFAAVLRGSLQIWDVVGIAMHSWYANDTFGSPVALLFDALGEQARPDISCKVYDLQLDAIAKGIE
ncbi:MBL fold metallo-hydrolase [Streptomyces toxytricini]|uniref:MBL fold metallo-hydrolase n=1 Tax=Streptomyces toxytricini TaxID=67369 RepID=A0ABW8EQU0_STRT5